MSEKHVMTVKGETSMRNTNETSIEREKQRKPYARARSDETPMDSKDLHTCGSCKLSEPAQFNGEIALHSPGVEGLNKMIVWVFPDVRICLSCGFAEFTVPERELCALKQRAPIDDAVVLIERIDRNAKEHPRCA
jgi:hypothetical protein